MANEVEEKDPLYLALIEKRKAERRVASASRALNKATTEYDRAYRNLYEADKKYFKTHEEWRNK